MRSANYCSKCKSFLMEGTECIKCNQKEEKININQAIPYCTFNMHGKICESTQNLVLIRKGSYWCHQHYLDYSPSCADLRNQLVIEKAKIQKSGLSAKDYALKILREKFIYQKVI